METLTKEDHGGFAKETKGVMAFFTMLRAVITLGLLTEGATFKAPLPAGLHSASIRFLQAAAWDFSCLCHCPKGQSVCIRYSQDLMRNIAY